jgi:foldase protein PrsA
MLEQQGTDLETAMEEQGLDESDLDEELRVAALQDAVIAELAADQEVSDEEVAEHFGEDRDQYRTAEARRLLVEIEEDGRTVRERLEAGEDFEVVAAEESLEERTDLGEVTAADLQVIPGLAEAVFEGAEVGGVAGPVESEQGWHVVEVRDREEPEVADVEDEIREELFAGAEREVLDEWLQEQAEAADIEVAEEFGEWDAEAGRVLAGE